MTFTQRLDGTTYPADRLVQKKLYEVSSENLHELAVKKWPMAHTSVGDEDGFHIGSHAVFELAEPIEKGRELELLAVTWYSHRDPLEGHERVYRVTQRYSGRAVDEVTINVMFGRKDMTAYASAE